MTPSLIRKQHTSIAITKACKVAVNGFNVEIELGHEIVIAGNRREDFERLQELAARAIDLFGGKETL